MIEGGEQFEIRGQLRPLRSRRPQPADALLEFTGRLQAIKAAAGMGIDHTERCLLAAQGLQHPDQYQMLENIGDVAGVEKVAIVHGVRSRVCLPVKRFRRRLSTNGPGLRCW